MKNIYIGILRLSVGFIFLWSFLDKLFGLGFATESSKSWLAGGSPTAGYLQFGTGGAFADMFKSLAGNPIVDWVFMLGLLGVGVAFVFGIAMKFASYSGALMMLLIYLSNFPPANNPIVDDHIIYILVILLLAHLDSGNIYGFGKSWNKTSLAKKLPFLQN